MKVKITKEEKELLTGYLKIMNDSNQSIHKRNWAKMMFDCVYEEASLRD